VDRREHGVGADGALEQLVDASVGGGLRPGPGGCSCGDGAIHVGRGRGGVGQRDAVDVHGRPAARPPARLRSLGSGRGGALDGRAEGGGWGGAGGPALCGGREDGRRGRAADSGGAPGYNGAGAGQRGSRTISSLFFLIIRWWMDDGQWDGSSP